MIVIYSLYIYRAEASIKFVVVVVFVITASIKFVELLLDIPASIKFEELLFVFPIQ